MYLTCLSLLLFASFVVLVALVLVLRLGLLFFLVGLKRVKAWLFVHGKFRASAASVIDAAEAMHTAITKGGCPSLFFSFSFPCFPPPSKIAAVFAGLFFLIFFLSSR